MRVPDLDTRFVGLEDVIFEVRADQYSRLEKLKSSMSFWRGGYRSSGGRFTTSCRSMSNCRHRLDGNRRKLGWTKGMELAKVAERDGQEFDCATWLYNENPEVLLNSITRFFKFL
jgi:hypothetical protein